MKRESQEKLDAMNKEVKEKGFSNVETICARGEPAKISYIRYMVSPSFEGYLQLRYGEEDRYHCDGKKRHDQHGEVSCWVRCLR